MKRMGIHVAVAFATCIALTAGAKTTKWKGEDGSWNDPGMWSDGVPGVEDSAELPYVASRAPAGYVITVEGNYAVGGIHFTDSGYAANAEGPVKFVGSGRLLVGKKTFYRPVIIDGPVIDFSGDTTEMPSVKQDITVNSGAFVYTNAAHSATMFFTHDDSPEHRPVQATLVGGSFLIDVYSCYDVPKSIFHQRGGIFEAYKFVDVSKDDSYRAYPQLDVKGGMFVLRPKLILGGKQNYDFGAATIWGGIEFAGGSANTEMSIWDCPHFAVSSELNLPSSSPVVRFPHGVVFESIGDWSLNNRLNMSVREAFTIDTQDKRDGVTPCTVGGWQYGFSLSSRNDITIKGGGSVNINSAETLFSNKDQTWDRDFFDAFRVLNGTCFRLNSKDRYRFNRIYTEELELGRDATLTFNAFNTILHATRSTIGEGAKLVIEVYGSSSGTVYAADVIPVLYAGADSSIANLAVELTGDGASDFDVKRDSHAVWLWRKTYAPTPGTGAYAWVGGAADANVTSGANWGNGASKDTLYNAQITVGVNQGATMNFNLENQSIYRFCTSKSSGPITVTGNAISILSPTDCSGSYAGVNNDSRYPLVFRNKVKQPASVAVLAAMTGYTSGDYGGSIEFLGGLDVANKLQVKDLVKIGGTSTLGSLQLYSSRGFVACVDVVNGASVCVTNQPRETTQTTDSFLRVDAGGEMRFTGGTGYRSTRVQSHHVNGTLAFEIPFISAAADHYFSGSGRLEMSQPRNDESMDSTIHIAERLKFYPGDWPTVDATLPNRILRLAVDTHATLGALQDWTYGPAADANPTTTAADRALVVANHETLTIDTENPDTGAAQTITFADPIVAGGDVVKQGEGTLAFACVDNVVTGTFRVTGGTLALAGALADATGWTEVLTAARIELDASFADSEWRVRQIVDSDGKARLCLKKRAGLCVIVK